MHIARSMGTLRERFYEKIVMADEDTCWMWLANTNPKGYGLIRDQGKYRVASVVSYELHVGPVPDGMHVCHECDNPGCINPYHLFLGTPSDNQLDCIRKGRKPPIHPNALAAIRHFTEDDVRTIRSQRKEGVAIKDLASRFNVTRGTISCIVRRVSYQHVD